MAAICREKSAQNYVGKYVRTRREHLGIDIATLSKKCQISIGHLVDFEGGLRELSLSQTQKLSQALNLPIALSLEDMLQDITEVGTEPDQNKRETLPKQGIALNRAFLDIKHHDLRQHILELAQTIASTHQQLSPEDVKNLTQQLTDLRGCVERKA